MIDRALAQLGVPYAWGGGNTHGPTRGIRDGGVADLHGDYNKIGFDCSGLMIYAFAAAGKRLPHYSGYQASADRRVPLSQKAPHPGSFVRVTSVRYGGIVGYATRLL